MSLDALIGGPSRTTRSPTARGRVIPSPATDPDLWVVIPSYSQARHYEVPPDQWASAAGDPAPGDECLVVFDDEGDVWAIVGGSGGGPVDPGSGDKSYVHTQGTGATTWAVAHGLGKFPAISVVDTGGSTLLPNVVYVDANNVLVTFGAPVSGKAYAN